MFIILGTILLVFPEYAQIVRGEEQAELLFRFIGVSYLMLGGVLFAVRKSSAAVKRSVFVLLACGSLINLLLSYQFHLSVNLLDLQLIFQAVSTSFLFFMAYRSKRHA
jgi:hypothetical protein